MLESGSWGHSVLQTRVLVITTFVIVSSASIKRVVCTRKYKPHLSGIIVGKGLILHSKL